MVGKRVAEVKRWLLPDGGSEEEEQNAIAIRKE
jgi:hypothetical protein